MVPQSVQSVLVRKQRSGWANDPGHTVLTVLNLPTKVIGTTREKSESAIIS